MTPPTSIDGTDITGATIDGTDVTEITVDGQTVFSAGLPNASSIVADYDVSATTSTNSIPDTTNNQPDVTGDTYGTTTKNGVRVAQLRSDVLEATLNTPQTRPYTAFFVAKIPNVSGVAYLWADNNFGWQYNNGDWRWWSGTEGTRFGTADTNYHVFGFYVENGAVELFVDGASDGGEKSTGSNDDINEIYFGGFYTGGFRSDADFARWILYDGDQRSIVSNVSNQLANIYNI